MKPSRIIINFLLIIFLLLLSYSIYNIYQLLHDHHTSKKEIEEIQEIVIENHEIIQEIEEETEEKEYILPELELNFEKLLEMNYDTIGWIEIRNTHINYPIVQTDNNEYYLTHSFYHDNNGDGWIFMNHLNNNNFKDPNTIIFGHDTHGNYMFSDLKRLYDGLLGNYIPITIYTKEETIHYNTFAIFLVEENDNQYLNVKLTQKDINQAITKSNRDFAVSATTEDKILTLSTCYHSSSQKVILLAKRIN